MYILYFHSLNTILSVIYRTGVAHLWVPWVSTCCKRKFHEGEVFHGGGNVCDTLPGGRCMNWAVALPPSETTDKWQTGDRQTEGQRHCVSGRSLINSCIVCVMMNVCYWTLYKCDVLLTITVTGWLSVFSLALCPVMQPIVCAISYIYMYVFHYVVNENFILVFLW